MYIPNFKNKFLQISPWLYTRSQIIILSLVELLISFCVFLSISFTPFPEKNLIAFFLSIIFVLSSYISGRYNYIKTNYRHHLILNIAKSVIVLFLSILFIYLYFDLWKK